MGLPPCVMRHFHQSSTTALWSDVASPPPDVLRKATPRMERYFNVGCWLHIAVVRGGGRPAGVAVGRIGDDRAHDAASGLSLACGRQPLVAPCTTVLTLRRPYY